MSGWVVICLSDGSELACAKSAALDKRNVPIMKSVLIERCMADDFG